MYINSCTLMLTQGYLDPVIDRLVLKAQMIHQFMHLKHSHANTRIFRSNN